MHSFKKVRCLLNEEGGADEATSLNTSNAKKTTLIRPVIKTVHRLILQIFFEFVPPYVGSITALRFEYSRRVIVIQNTARRMILGSECRKKLESEILVANISVRDPTRSAR